MRREKGLRSIRDDEERVQGYLRFTTVGIQFVVVFGAFLGLGYWLDAKWKTSPYLILAGTLIGGTAAFYTLYREVFGKTRGRKR
ncbi:MAG: AtpZ/AtpI family protein [Planctomycetes bacterium]|nr:AtpZ/AtpI family protein [Planctomycetota bacterium]MBI3844738.1 AtpZ/AtpI family protein [Planctomycetota bacterium]